jgi:hypothetical protein
MDLKDSQSLVVLAMIATTFIGRNIMEDKPLRLPTKKERNTHG